MTKLLLHPFAGWGWHKDNTSIAVPTPFWVEICDTQNQEHPRKYYQGKVLQEDHVLSGFDVLLTGRGEPLDLANYVIDGQIVSSYNKSKKSVVVGHVAIKEII